MASTTEGSKEERLEALNQKLTARGLRGYWMMNMSPREEEQPKLLKWSEVHPLLEEAGQVVTIGPEVERRNLAGYQVVMPGEVALAHRHTQSAMRFVMEGDGTAYTTTNGEPAHMEPGDLVIQPSWGWHDHQNPGKVPVIWMDILDLDIVGVLGPRLRDYWAEGESQPLSHTEGYSARKYGLMRPPSAVGGSDTPPPMAYKWKDTYPALMEAVELGETDPHDGVILDYTNPANGGPVVPTMSCHIQYLQPGEETSAHRHMGHNRYSVVQGQGQTIVDLTDPTTLEWGEKDSFTLPSWRWHKLKNTSKNEPAILFSVNDSPAYKAFGFYREEGR